MPKKTPEHVEKRGQPTKLTGPLGELVEALGGVQALADAIGVTTRTINRWGTAEVWPPPKPARLALAALAVQHKVDPPFPIEDGAPMPAWLRERIAEEE